MKNAIRWLSKFSRTHTPEQDDPQAHRVYRMEDDLRGGSLGVTSEQHLRQIVNHACGVWKVKRAQLHFVGRPKLKEYGWTTDTGIYLNVAQDGQNMWTLLHELAHWIVDRRDYAAETHGPEFVWIYMELLDAYKVMPRDCMQVLCDKYNVVVE